MSTPNFLAELKRRNVFRVGVAFLVIAWLLAQVGDVVLDSFDAPGWIMRALLIALAVGFPVALILAWVFDITPEGIQRDPADTGGDPATVTPTASNQRNARILNRITILSLVAALGYFIATHNWSARDDAAISIEADAEKSIAVLPFDNLSDITENAFFASGVQEDIAIALAKISDLSVTPTKSVQRYAGDTRDASVIAAELNVKHLMTGNVRRAGNTVRVSVSLVNAASNRTIWADNYDAELSDVFEIQKNISEKIVAAMQAQLTPEEAKAIGTVLTDNIDAYDQYTEARVILRTGTFDVTKFDDALALLEQAVVLDPEFAVAHALLASVQMKIYWRSVQGDPELITSAKASIDRAFALQPDLPEAHSALAEYYYRGFRNYPKALQQLEIAHRRFPNNADVLDMLSVTQRRLGLWEESIENLQAYNQLVPNELAQQYTLLETLTFANRNAAALEYGYTLLSRFPDNDGIKFLLARVHYSGFGDLDSAREIISTVGPPDSMSSLSHLSQLYVRTRDAEGMFSIIEAAKRSVPEMVAAPWLPLMFEAHTYDILDQPEKASQLAAQVVEALTEYRNVPGEDVAWMRLILVQQEVLLGNNEAALELAYALAEEITAELDAMDDPGDLAVIAYVLLRAGDKQRGYELLSELVGKPASLTIWDLKLSAAWDQFRDDPEFMAIVGI